MQADVADFSSSVVHIALPSYSAYAATKGAVDAMTLVLAEEPRGRDVTVNAVAPGPTATPLFLDGKPQEAADRLASMALLERLGTPEDVAEVVAFLAGPALGHRAGAVRQRWRRLIAQACCASQSGNACRSGTSRRLRSRSPR
ncbi:SDR family oxidoreductase [Geodermatophilus sp. URMC 62]|uniref:SDR family oxidoreductase n=1 Tax=Geodermatophilus sp. URMC 62 TaxID=3423414 RepID=UPI00406D309F